MLLLTFERNKIIARQPNGKEEWSKPIHSLKELQRARAEFGGLNSTFHGKREVDTSGLYGVSVR